MLLAVSNTSPLTNLAIIGRLDLVRSQLSAVTVPNAVWQEVLALPHENGKADLLAAHAAGWLRVRPISNFAVAASLRMTGLDPGESEAIALASELGAQLLMDERKGRMAARRLSIPVAGALAILAAGRKAGMVSSVRIEIARLRSEAGFFVSAGIETEILKLVGEV